LASPEKTSRLEKISAMDGMPGAIPVIVGTHPPRSVSGFVPSHFLGASTPLQPISKPLKVTKFMRQPSVKVENRAVAFPVLGSNV